MIKLRARPTFILTALLLALAAPAIADNTNRDASFLPPPGTTAPVALEHEPISNESPPTDEHDGPPEIAPPSLAPTPITPNPAPLAATPVSLPPPAPSVPVSPPKPLEA